MADSLTPSIDVDEGGVWTGVQDWPLIGIHATLTADNEVLSFGTDELGMQGAQVYYDVWDYETDTHHTLESSTPTDIFCSVSVLIPETGDILIVGGDARPLGSVNAGVKDVNIFDADDYTLAPLPTTETGLEYARWYASAVTLSNGKILIVGGRDEDRNGVGTPELYTPGGGFKSLTGAASTDIANGWFYPRAWEASDGTVAIVTNLWQGTMHRLDPSGDGSIEYYGDLPFNMRNMLPAVMYREDELIMMSDAGELWSVDISGPSPIATLEADIGGARYFSNMLILPNGDIAIVGGGSSTNISELATLYTEAVIYSPNTGTVTVGDAEQEGRLYHSTALLMPDGSILSLGGGAPGPFTQLNGEFYYPDMLFEEDGDRAIAIDITEAPDTINQLVSFQITVDNPDSVARVTMVKSGTVTHTLNMETRFAEPEFTVDSTTGVITIDPTDNANVLTPGAWMVFVIDGNGVPSEAATVMVGLGGEHYMPELGTFVTLSGTAEYVQGSDTEFLLTPSEANAVGSVTANERIDFSSDFTLSLEMNFGAVDGADGIAVLFHNDPYTSDAVGTGAGGFGVSGISKGFGIEFDTWNNLDAEVGDTHSGFISTAGSLAEVGGHTVLSSLEDGNWHDVVVSWNAATQTLGYSLDGAQIDSITADLASTYLGGDNGAHLMISAATGGANNVQSVRINDFDGLIEGQASPPTAEDDDNGPYLVSDLTNGDGQVIKINGTNVLANDSDPEGDTLSIVAVNGVAVTSDGWQGWRDASSGGQIVVNTDGRVQFRDREGDFNQLALGEQIETSVTYTLSDGNGGTSQATISYVIEGEAVVGENVAPDALDDTSDPILASALTSSGSAVKINGTNVLLNDSDANGDAISITDIDGTPVTSTGWQGWREASIGGEIVLNTDGRVQFRDSDGDFANLPLGQTVETSITYTISDGNGGSDTATVTFVVEGDTPVGPNEAPIAGDDLNAPFAMADLYDAEGDPVKLSGINVFANDSDPNGDTIAITEINGEAVTSNGWFGWRDASNGGEISVNTDGRVKFRDTDFDFTDLAPGMSIDTTLTYQISDNNGGTDTATIVFTIEEDEFNLALDVDLSDSIV